MNPFLSRKKMQGIHKLAELWLVAHALTGEVISAFFPTFPTLYLWNFSSLWPSPWSGPFLLLISDGVGPNLCHCFLFHVRRVFSYYLFKYYLRAFRFSLSFLLLLFNCSILSDSVISWTAVCQASLFVTFSQSFLKLMSFESVIPSNHLVLCCPLLLPSVFPSIRVFSNELALCIRWPNFGASVSVLSFWDLCTVNFGMFHVVPEVS